MPNSNAVGFFHRNPANHTEIVRAFLVAPSVEYPSVTYFCPIGAAHITIRGNRCRHLTVVGVTDDLGLRLPNTNAAYIYAANLKHLWPVRAVSSTSRPIME